LNVRKLRSIRLTFVVRSLRNVQVTIRIRIRAAKVERSVQQVTKRIRAEGLLAIHQDKYELSWLLPNNAVIPELMQVFDQIV
jgi:hypothetical protein